MKKKISLVLALVIMVIPTFGFQMMQASAAAPKYEEYETFENASNLFDDTAFWSDAVVQEIKSDNPISGNKSLYIESTADWCNLFGTSLYELALKANTYYRFSVAYKMVSTEDSNIQFVLSNGKYARFNTHAGNIWAGTPGFFESGIYTSIEDKGDIKTFNIVFMYNEADDGWLKLQSCDNSPIKMYIDDVRLTALKPAETYEKFDAAASISDTIFTSKATGKEITENNAASGKGLRITNAKEDWLELVRTDLNKIALVPDTDYNISFSYKTPDIQLNNDAYNLCNFQVRTTGGQYARFNGYIPNYLEGTNTIKYNAKREADGTVVIGLRMHTKADGSDTGFFIEGGIWQHLEQFGDLDVTFDDFHIAPADTIECETFENISRIEEIAYTTSMAHNEIAYNEHFGGKAIHLYNDKVNAWNSILGLNTSFCTLEADTLYQLSFKYYLEDCNNMRNIQLEIQNASNSVVRHARFDTLDYSFNNSVSELQNNTHFYIDPETGVVTVYMTFRTAADGSEIRINLTGDCWAIGVCNIWLDDISLTKSYVNYGGVQNGCALVSVSDLDDVAEIGYEIKNASGTVKDSTDYVNPLVSDNSYFIAVESGVYYGDLNMDGHFDAVDLAYLRKLLINASASEHAYWDINGDNSFDIRDLVRCKNVLSQTALTFNFDDFGIDFVYPFALNDTVSDGTVTPYTVRNGMKIYGLSETIAS